MTATCEHCGLPVGRLGERREVGGDDHWFCCYGCCLAYQVHHGAREEPEAASLLVRLGVGAFLAMNIMLFSLLLYSGALERPDGDGAGGGLTALVHGLLWVLASALLVVLGGPFLRGAWQGARARRLTADALVSLGALAAYLYSAGQVVLGSGQVYFDTAAMVLVLFTLGRYLEAQGRVRALRSLAPLLAAERAELVVVGADGETMRPVTAVHPGDTVRVRPGERVGVDGEVIDGRSECDESCLTGQPQPRPKAPGARVHAGSLNGYGQLWVRASVAGDATRWVHISRLLREALARKSVLGETVDRAAAWFIPWVLLLALATVLFWAGQGGFGQALMTGLAVLVVACPCSLGLAAPLATALGIGQAAERGVLIRGAGVLERLARLRGVAFDKTGTLTAGRLRPVALNAEGASEPQVLRLAHALALASSHPLARAIVAHGKHTGVSARPAANAWEHPGAGVTGLIDGSLAALGSASLMAALGWPAPQALIEAPLPEGAVPVYVAWGGRTRGRLTLADADRPEAGEVVAALGRHGLATLLLSGDSPRAVARTAARLGIATWHAGLTPEAKADVLRDWAARHGPIAMVGDGLNDAPVLAAAAVGIAVGDAADLAKESADVVIPAGGLATLPWLLGLARDVRRSVRANLLWAFGYNTVALTLAVCGLLRPVFAAGLMAGSSLVVVLRSLRASRAGRALGTSPDRPAPGAPAPDACGARACARRPAAQPPLSA